jgi:hypothetical protein
MSSEHETSAAEWRRVRTWFETASIRRGQLEIPSDVEWIAWRRVLVPRRFAALLRDARYPVRIEIELEDGQARCVALSRIADRVRVDDGSGRPVYSDKAPLTAELLRQLPLKRLVSEIAAEAADHFGRRVPAAEEALRQYAELDARLDQLSKRARSRAGDGVSDALLADVAEIYDEAAAAGLPPTRTTWERLNRRKGKGPARSTVARWISQARDRGLLPPTEPRKARAWRAAREEQNDG